MKGFVLWFTGLSGSGKSTLTAMLAAELRRRGVHVETLDGDDVRKHLSKGLGFSKEDRDANIRRVGFVAKLIARSGGCAIAAAISPYREVRDELRRSIESFCEVYTECPLSVLSERDPKGLYKKALAGEIKNFTGVSDPYEPPLNPEVHLHTDLDSPEESLRRIIGTLEELEFIPEWDRRLHEPADSRRALTMPHGGELIERSISSGAVSQLDPGWPRIALSPERAIDVACIAVGLYSPLRGFLTSRDYRRVLDGMRLESGTPWPIPIVLEVPPTTLDELRRSQNAVLVAPDGNEVALLDVAEVFAADVERESEALGTPASEWYVGGDIRVFRPTEEFSPFAEAASPRSLRARFEAASYSRILAFPNVLVPTRGLEYLARSGLEFADALLALTCVQSELGLDTRLALLDALFKGYFPETRTATALTPTRDRGNKRRRLIFDALMAKNLGASHIVLNRHVPALAAFDSYMPGELGIQPWLVDDVVFSPRAGAFATTRTAPDKGERVEYADVLAALRDRSVSESQLLRPEVAAILKR